MPKTLTLRFMTMGAQLGVFHGPKGNDREQVHMCNIFGPKTDRALMVRVIEAGAKALGIEVETDVV